MQKGTTSNFVGFHGSEEQQVHVYIICCCFFPDRRVSCVSRRASGTHTHFNSRMNKAQRACYSWELAGLSLLWLDIFQIFFRKWSPSFGVVSCLSCKAVNFETKCFLSAERGMPVLVELCLSFDSEIMTMAKKEKKALIRVTSPFSGASCRLVWSWDGCLVMSGDTWTKTSSFEGAIFTKNRQDEPQPSKEGRKEQSL